MNSPFVAIGVYSFKDLSKPDTASAIFDLFAETTPRLIPEYVNISEPVNVPIVSKETWMDWWSSPAWHRVDGSKSEYSGGALWRRRHSLQGSGMANFVSPHGTIPAHKISMRYRWSPRIPWKDFFQGLCEITKPAYAMLHLFVEDELERSRKLSIYTPAACRFTGAVTYGFTWSVATDGNIRKPDAWDKERQTAFKHLPELSWANFFGPQFAGQFEPALLMEKGAEVRELDYGHTVFLSPLIEDIAADFGEFCAKRNQIREAFSPGFFRMPTFEINE